MSMSKTQLPKLRTDTKNSGERAPRVQKLDETCPLCPPGGCADAVDGRRAK